MILYRIVVKRLDSYYPLKLLFPTVEAAWGYYDSYAKRFEHLTDTKCPEEFIGTEEVIINEFKLKGQI